LCVPVPTLPNHPCGRLRGRPPFAPFTRAAAAFALDFRRPPRRPEAAANSRLPNVRSIRPGTYTSMSTERHDNASPAGEMLTDSSAEVDAWSRPGIIRLGIAIDPPLLNVRLKASWALSYEASTSADGSAACASPRARARAKRSRSLAFSVATAMDLLPMVFQQRCVLRHHSFGDSDVAIGNRSHDFRRLTCGQINLHDGTGFGSVYMRRRMIERIDPDLESPLAQHRRHWLL
jgi:hypothetical protein